MNTQQQRLGEALRAMYEVISFPEGAAPDWERMKVVFSPNARITRVTPEGTDHCDLASFQAMAMDMIDMGVYTGFHEREVARRAEVFGAIAHVLSVYETKRSAEAIGYLARGVNSIQLVWDGDAWRVLSLLWDEATELLPLDIHGAFRSEVLHHG